MFDNIHPIHEISTQFYALKTSKIPNCMLIIEAISDEKPKNELGISVRYGFQNPLNHLKIEDFDLEPMLIQSDLHNIRIAEVTPLNEEGQYSLNLAYQKSESFVPGVYTFIVSIQKNEFEGQGLLSCYME